MVQPKREFDWRKALGWVLIAIGVLIIWALIGWCILTAVADAKPHPGHGCATRKECRWRVHRLRAIAPYRAGFLGPTGACESGTGSYNLHIGLRAHSRDGYYHGRYQFGQVDWIRAGGHGDPHNASWLEQAYRAVRWLHINGRTSWPNC